MRERYRSIAETKGDRNVHAGHVLNSLDLFMNLPSRDIGHLRAAMQAALDCQNPELVDTVRRETREWALRELGLHRSQAATWEGKKEAAYTQQFYSARIKEFEQFVAAIDANQLATLPFGTKDRPMPLCIPPRLETKYPM